MLWDALNFIQESPFDTHSSDLVCPLSNYYTVFGHVGREMETYIYCDKLLGLQIGSFHVLLCPDTSRVSDDCEGIHVDGVVLPIELILQDLSYLLVVLGYCYFPCLFIVAPM